MKIKTSELTGAALDWAVAKCEGYSVGVWTHAEILAFQLKGETDPERIASLQTLFADAPAEACFISENGNKHTVNIHLYAETGCSTMRFSTNWAQGGPIIEREIMEIDPPFTTESGMQLVNWYASIRNVSGQQGPTPLIAAMRCYVASKLGDEVEIPEELV